MVSATLRLLALRASTTRRGEARIATVDTRSVVGLEEAGLRADEGGEEGEHDTSSLFSSLCWELEKLEGTKGLFPIDRWKR